MIVTTLACLVTALGVLLVLGAVAVDRERIRRSLTEAEGRTAGLQLDRDALAARVAELTGYLSLPASWDVAVTPPAQLIDAAAIDRWTSATADVRVKSHGVGEPRDATEPHGVIPPQRLPR